MISSNDAVINDCYFNPISDGYKEFVSKQMRLIQRLPAKKLDRYIEKKVFLKLLARRTVAIRIEHVDGAT